MARARQVELDCEASFSATAAQVIEVRAAEVFEQAHGALDLDDVERVHDMRVATRRLRVALEVFQPCFPAKPHRKALKRIKELADALGRRRDLDVEIELLEGLAADVDDADRPALISLIKRRRTKQRQANDALAPFVARKRLKKLRKRLGKLIERARQ